MTNSVVPCFEVVWFCFISSTLEFKASVKHFKSMTLYLVERYASLCTFHTASIN